MVHAHVVGKHSSRSPPTSFPPKHCNKNGKCAGSHQHPPGKSRFAGLASRSSLPETLRPLQHVAESVMESSFLQEGVFFCKFLSLSKIQFSFLKTKKP